jgi:hypothetical protein
VLSQTLATNSKNHVLRQFMRTAFSEYNVLLGEARAGPDYFSDQQKEKQEVSMNGGSNSTKKKTKEKDKQRHSPGGRRIDFP